MINLLKFSSNKEILSGVILLKDIHVILLARVADLSFVPSPGPLSHASITDLLGFRVWVNGSVCINRILRAS